jgi:hypothetical protein
MRLAIENIDIFKITISLIFYHIYFMNSSDSFKLAEFLYSFFENIYKLNLKPLLTELYGSYGSQQNYSLESPNVSNSPNHGLNNQNAIQQDKDLNYTEILESIKSKTLQPQEVEKFYGLDNLSKMISTASIHTSNNLISSLIQSDLSKDPQLINNGNQKENNSDDKLSSSSEISLTPSLQSQDTGKTYKNIIIRDPEQCQTGKTLCQSQFLPPKSKGHILMYANEHIFVVIRYIYCIYERLNKVNKKHLILFSFMNTP